MPTKSTIRRGQRRLTINADKPHLWKDDISKSVDLFNAWFMKFAPKAYRDTRISTTEAVSVGLVQTSDLRDLTPKMLRANPCVLPVLRMCTCPPLARDRLVGLAYVGKALIGSLEDGKLPARMPATELDRNLARVTAIIVRMLDADIFPWLGGKSRPTKRERRRAATIVADRLCGAVSDPIIRNAQERRQLARIGGHLEKLGYERATHPSGHPLTAMAPGTYDFRMNVVAGAKRKVNIPIDVVIQPKRLRPTKVPILIEAKSAGDFTNVNKRRKEEATKMAQLRDTFGPSVEFVLFLCGYFDSGYLGYEAAEGIDWIWEHRMADFGKLGL